MRLRTPSLRTKNSKPSEEGFARCIATAGRRWSFPEARLKGTFAASEPSYQLIESSSKDRGVSSVRKVPPEKQTPLRTNYRRQLCHTVH